MKESKKSSSSLQNMDARELEFPETTFVRDVENRVFQAIVIQCLAKIKDIALLEGNLIDDLLGRDAVDRVKGVYVEQDLQKHSLSVRVEIALYYGVSIPEKAEEIQTKIVEDLSSLTGLHVSAVHVIFKNLLTERPLEKRKEDYTSRF